MISQPRQTQQGVFRKSRTWLLFATMLFVIYGAFFIAKGAVNFVGTGDAARMVFFHVPIAVMSSLCFVFACFYAIRLLWKREEVSIWETLDTDIKSSAMMELGFFSAIHATVVGSLFSKAQWDSYWNWDPRQTSIVGLLLIYAAYLLLRNSLQDNREKRSRLCAVYIAITLVPANFLVWVYPRLPALQSLHPPAVLTDPSNTSPSYKLVLASAFIGFTLLFNWLFELRVRHQRLSLTRERKNL